MAFAVRAVKLARWLREEQKEFSLADQVLRSGTSIGANLAEAEYAISKKDFLAKTYIALKECAETAYWLELLLETEYIADHEHQSIAADSEELRKLLSATTKTLKQTTPPSSLLTPHS